jgi:hypothetical protein
LSCTGAFLNQNSLMDSFGTQELTAYSCDRNQVGL